MLQHVTAYFLFFAWLVLGIGKVCSQQAVLPVTNFSVNDYEAANQNWDIATNDQGLTFVANHQGLLVFNGQHWKLYTLPNRTIIRSVFCDGNRVYTGSYEEFGYWEKNDFGDYEYTSLTSHIDPAHKFKNEEFWEIIRWGKNIVFRSFSTVYIYNGEKITVLNPGFIITKIASYQQELILGKNNGEVYRYTEQGNIALLEGTDEIDDPIADLVVNGDELIIGTKSQGCFSYDFRYPGLKKWDDAINGSLKAYELNKIHLLGKNRVVFGTIKNGVIIYHRETGATKYINRHLGLQNNTVLGLDIRGDNLWLALDMGVDAIKVNSEFSFYKEGSGELGTVYDIAFYNNTIYMGSNTGVYYFRGDELVFLENSQGHVWDLEVVGGRLLCGHNTGTYDISNNSFEKISSFSGGYRIRKVPGKENTYIQCTYIGLTLFVYRGGKWEVSPVKGIGFPIDNIVFENRHSIWASHPYKGFFRIKLSNDYRNATVEREFSNSKLKDFRTQVFRVGNDIALYNSGNWYTYNPVKDHLEEFIPFEKYTGKKLLFQDQGHYWFTDTGKNGIIYTDLARDTVIAQKELVRRLTPLFEKVVKKNDSLYYFTLNDGFAEFNLYKYRKRQNRPLTDTVQITRVETNYTPYAFSQNPGIPFKNARSIRFSMYYPNHFRQDFSYRLSGSMAQEGRVENGTLLLQNLTYGTYDLEVWPVSLGPESPAALRYSFRIHPPWYLSVPMKIVYLLIFLAGVYFLFWWNKKLIRDHQRKLTRRMYQEKQRKLEILERENLEKEVKMKQKELMNSTLMISKKNELILEIQNELRRIRNNNVNEYRVKSLISKTTEAIHNQEDWQVFETNFNELHDDFFKRLVQRYPKLTTKDMKLCGYLKMNLTSKEIAPLMGITLRGVEIHRYRLRKKLGLDKDQDLVKFLMVI
ncbi:helix-turn-helix and ligand-binding sensor domain-containing protein [Sinomicrobium weinanense]|uniref:Two component regulator three Y domain-containing protein n=1 Tax=Sinomicrobium weinanense TaxID=2842200 RepID=A0A926JT45_9FLAO|nr:Two component regulator three Y domain-containing protein [Sinomicrobium weinanense]MBC9797008.1 Two component regulator three Y domain-containing protein [Sinomicrobium weinanense]MBU3123294.1 Two component regulator three Y domain-containing protein [Sinomicrobium weinanense]